MVKRRKTWLMTHDVRTVPSMPHCPLWCPAWCSFHSSWNIKRWECYENTARFTPYPLLQARGNWEDENITKAGISTIAMQRHTFKSNSSSKYRPKWQTNKNSMPLLTRPICTLLTFPDIGFCEVLMPRTHPGVKAKNAKKQIDDVLSQVLFLLLHLLQSIGPRFG